jgi:hypothetical protein
MKLIISKEAQHSRFEFSLGMRAASALVISVVADALDYVGAPIFALPIIGDMTDLIVTALLYRITKSKVTVVINAIEFIPFIGDFMPVYTISTLLWIFNVCRKKCNRAQPIRSQWGKLQIRTRRASAILRSGNMA